MVNEEIHGKIDFTACCQNTLPSSVDAKIAAHDRSLLQATTIKMIEQSIILQYSSHHYAFFAAYHLAEADKLGLYFTNGACQ